MFFQGVHAVLHKASGCQAEILKKKIEKLGGKVSRVSDCWSFHKQEAVIRPATHLVCGHNKSPARYALDIIAKNGLKTKIVDIQC
mmetsp:Transcript_15378/g.31202  ORF Transcript_15378/g.31202 Transcript_15378/m.31202 type:complete len:85 (-) Transcript_15378:635-889(-)